MPINATVTAKAGAAQQATAISVANQQSMVVDMGQRTVMFYAGPPTSAPEKEFDLVGVTTFTVTISGATMTVTIS